VVLLRLRLLSECAVERRRARGALSGFHESKVKFQTRETTHIGLKSECLFERVENALDSDPVLRNSWSSLGGRWTVACWAIGGSEIV
jgi:hypothetical protein